MPKIKIIGNIKYILGENDYDNHNIIKKAKSNWWWFHLDDNASGHCIVCSEKITHNNIIIAGNYIKKYSKLKKNNNVKICYCQISNLIIHNKPGLVGFINNNINTINCYSTIIYHYSKYKTGNGIHFITNYDNYIENIKNKEYIISGIYGRLNKDICFKNNKNHEIIINLNNPIIFKNYNDYELFKNIITMFHYEIHHNTNLKNIANLFCENIKVFDLFFDINEVYCQIKKYMSDFKNKKQYLMLPINYIFNNYNYDGLYIKEINEGIHLINYPSKKNNIIFTL